MSSEIKWELLQEVVGSGKGAGRSGQEVVVVSRFVGESAY